MDLSCNPMQGNEVELSGWLFPVVETRGNHLWGLPPSFQCRESRWNRQVDCFQVWKLSGNHIGVSQKWKLRGNYWCHDSLWFPAGFHFWETAFFTQWSDGRNIPSYNHDCLYPVLKEYHSNICAKYWQLSRISFWTKHLFIVVNRSSRKLFTHME